uniref:Uncharacterized protein n=1 Tax=Peronospora matthiolae TaxID=2874970 RepID=A0AAV1VCB0_9STRA
MEKNARCPVLSNAPVCPSPASLPVFPPLPPLPPRDGSQSLELSKEMGDQLPVVAWPESFFQQQQQQCVPFDIVLDWHMKREKDFKTSAVSTNEKDAGREWEDAGREWEDAGSESTRSCARPSPSLHDSIHSGRTIWSITPEELTALAEEAHWKPESDVVAKRQAVASISKGHLDEFELQRAVQKMKEMAALQSTRTFKKYYGLPIIPLSAPLLQHEAEAVEEKVTSIANVADTGAVEKAENALDYSQIFGLSATTPTFYPRQTADSNDLIQMLKSSLTRKVAPHMDWWPGDWKCTNCGNHVLFCSLVRSFTR